VYIGVDVIIGDRCRVMPKASLDTGVEIRNDVFIGPFSVFTNDASPRAWSTRDLTGIRWVVEEGASVGAFVVVLPEVNIGHHALVAAHSVVNHDVPPHALMAGSPARRVGWVCTEAHCMRLVRKLDQGSLYACTQMGHEVIIPDEWRLPRRAARRAAAG
jgi:acetyltransferase-like isoleucine patch superfamily enzyme